MEPYLVLIVIINLGLSGVVAYVANQKGRSGGAFFALSFLLSFVVGILVVMALPALGSPADRASSSFRVACPHCREMILADALVCKHCGRDVPPNVEALAAAERVGVERKQASDQNRSSAKVFQGAFMIFVGGLVAASSQELLFPVLGAVIFILGLVRLIQGVRIPKVGLNDGETSESARGAAAVSGSEDSLATR